ncbi:unnamed protein product [Schistosoma rodhaini]|uniref:Uncharacterized protein n=1 Tax=Schistosoma rodhaini TaxID=6188 RepID=A0AA85GB84_9TREM|nr:unnamed protein product [Schistosoma rodhaini]
MNLIITFFSVLHFLLPPCYTFILPKSIRNISSQNAFFISDWLVKTNKLHVASSPLVEDIDLDGNLDVYFSTVNGVLYGISNVLKCVTGNPCSILYENWPVTHHGEIFFSTPLAVDVYAEGLKSVLFISHHAAVFTYDYLGNLLSHFQVSPLFLLNELDKIVCLCLVIMPDYSCYLGVRVGLSIVVVWLSYIFWNSCSFRSYLVSQIPDIILDRSTLSQRDLDKNSFKSIRWASTDNQLPTHSERDIRLHPIVYTDPIILTSAISRSNVNDINFLYTDLLHIALNFVSYHSHSTTASLNESSSTNEGLLIAAIVNIPRCALFYLKNEDFKFCSPRLKVLEVDWLSVKLPPYIFSSPTINANVLGETRVKDRSYIDSYYSFITTFSGNIHVAQLTMLNSHVSQPSLEVNNIFIDSYSFHITPMTLSCVPSPCPLNKMKLNKLQSSVLTCCLQVDIYSCLRLVLLVSIKKYHSQIYWTYCPAISNTTMTTLEYGEQTGQVIIVPGCQKLQTCSPWSVYTTPDGYVHAVDIQTGLSAPGYPVSLFTMYHNVTNLSIGSGLLYQREDYTYWLVFTDVYTNLIHLRLHNPLVIISHNHNNMFNHQTNSLQTISLSPKPLPLPAGVSTSPSYLLLSSHGLMLLRSRSLPIVQSSSPSLLTYSKYIDNVDKSVTQFINVQFVNDHLEPIDSIILDDNKRILNYVIRDCSYHLTLFNESILAKRFLVKLLTSFGVPISEWSNAYITTNITCHHHCYCFTGSLSIQHSLPLSSYHNELYLSVIDSTNGYFIVNYPILTSSKMISTRIILQIGSYQTQLIVSLIYLPGVYLLIGLIIIHSVSMLITKQKIIVHGNKMMKQSI